MNFFRDAGGRSNYSARRSFALGELSLRAYLAGGNVRFLLDAEASFSLLDPQDRKFDSARFYLGITKVQLRHAKESIDILEDLRQRKGYDERADAPLANKIALQLAYAHIKQYTDEDYEAAGRELQRVQDSASRTKNGDLLLQAKAIRVFLYSVMAGRSKQESCRPEYARNALELADELKETARSPEVLFEAYNALGIAWMRIAEANWQGFGDRATSWTNAQLCYDQALSIVPNSVRVLQNLAKMRLLQVEHGFPDEPAKLLADAESFVNRSLEVNDQDQYPYLELARIAVKKGNRKAAEDSIQTGKSRPGAVKESEWKEVSAEAAALE